MTALKDYRNGALPWPEGMSGTWPRGETRVVPDTLRQLLAADGVGEFETQFHKPTPAASAVVDKPAPAAKGKGKE